MLVPPAKVDAIKARGNAGVKEIFMPRPPSTFTALMKLAPANRPTEVDIYLLIRWWKPAHHKGQLKLTLRCKIRIVFVNSQIYQKHKKDFSHNLKLWFNSFLSLIHIVPSDGCSNQLLVFTCCSINRSWLPLFSNKTQPAPAAGNFQSSNGMLFDYLNSLSG